MIINDIQDQEGNKDENTDEDMDSSNGDIDDETEPMELTQRDTRVLSRLRKLRRHQLPNDTR